MAQTTRRKTATKTRRQTAQERNYVQFSKKLITAVMLFWGLIRIISVVAAIVNPDSSTNMAAIVRGVDDIAMVNCLAYTGNSISEKISLGYFKYKSKELDTEKEDEEDEEDSSNG